MSADVIQTQYDQLEQIAARFGRQAEATAQTTSRVQQSLRGLQAGGWEGRGAAAFFGEMERSVLPSMQRLADAMVQSQKVTSQIKAIMQEAEREASQPFRGGPVADYGGGQAVSSAPVGAGVMAIGVAVPGPISGFVGAIGQGTAAIGGWIGGAASGAWGWIQDHRNEVALGAAVVAAGVAVVATGGLAAPIIAGAVAAGGVTLAINAASPQYSLMDGVLSNTIGGAFIGYGVGTAGAALGGLRAAATTTPWAASVGGAAAQVTQASQVAAPLARVLTYAPPALQAISGAGMVVSSGGADIVLPTAWERPAHAIGAVAGIGASAANVGLAFGGNRLIQYAWANPRIHPPGGSLVGGGNSALFQSHHIYPQNQLGRLPFSSQLLDDAVILPTGPRGTFIPNLHTAAGGYHPLLRQAANQVNFAALAPAQQLQFLQQFNASFSRGLLTGVSGPLVNLGVWGGVQIDSATGTH
jgi:WXG100 family type VII secretion target